LQTVDPSLVTVAVPPADNASVLVGLQPSIVPATNAYAVLLQNLMEQTLRRQTLFLTSANAGEGTTTTAANLAGVLSRQSPSVLLVDLRLTAPRLMHLLGDPADVPGFEDGLRGVVPLNSCVFTLAGGSLNVIAAKTAMTAEEAVQQSGPLNDFLEWAEERFEWVILDCPPLSSPEWTRWFELNADPVLLVVRAGVTRRRGLRKAARQLKDRLAAAILNDNPVAS
jgi:Mrp family chromosome partitioning ATPase